MAYHTSALGGFVAPQELSAALQKQKRQTEELGAALRERTGVVRDHPPLPGQEGE